MSEIDEGLRRELQRQGVWVTSMQELYNWGRKNSIWPLQFGLACCAIEMIATAASRYDIARFGGEIFRPSPRQADLMIVAGTVTKKMAPQIVRLYNQMPDPKYVISMGACAISGGPFNSSKSTSQGESRKTCADSSGGIFGKPAAMTACTLARHTKPAFSPSPFPPTENYWLQGVRTRL